MLKKAGLTQCSAPLLPFPKCSHTSSSPARGCLSTVSWLEALLSSQVREMDWGAHIPPHHMSLGWVTSVKCHCPIGCGSSLSPPESPPPPPPLSQPGSRRKALLLLTLGLAMKGLGAVVQPGCKPHWHVLTGSPEDGLFLPAPSTQGPCWDQAPATPDQYWGFCPSSSK